MATGEDLTQEFGQPPNSKELRAAQRTAGTIAPDAMQVDDPPPLSANELQKREKERRSKRDKLALEFLKLMMAHPGATQDPTARGYQRERTVAAFYQADHFMQIAEQDDDNA